MCSYPIYNPPVAAPFHFEHSVAFSPDAAPEVLRSIPTLPGVFALHGPPAPEGQPQPQPYLTRAADLRRRITRMLAPPQTEGEPQSKRLNLRSRVARIDYTVTGSEFESTLALYHASAAIFGLAEARRRLRLHTPYYLRFTAENAYPRVYSTNRLSKRAFDNLYGPFPSRAAADRYCDAVLDLFKLRRCYEDLAPYPEHPGCVYQEMKKCLAPCNQACTPEGAAAYSAEAAAVKRFFDTRGESMIVDIGLEREVASSAMHFEKAAALHAQWHKVKAAQALADELVQPIPKLRAIVVQKAAQHLSSEMWADEAAENVEAQHKGEPQRLKPDSKESSGGTAEAAPLSKTNLSAASDAADAEPAASVFLLHSGCITGPARLSTLGVRAVKEQTSVGSSLFAQPLMLEAIPLTDETLPSEVASPLTSAESPELRATNLIASLEEQASSPTDLATLSDHLSLLRRWYYRPEKQRTGEVFFPRDDHSWPIRRILRGAARMALGEPAPMAETHRELVVRNPADEAQKPARTKVLHKGRPDVERTVPIPDTPPDAPPAFTSRRSRKP